MTIKTEEGECRIKQEVMAGVIGGNFGSQVERTAK